MEKICRGGAFFPYANGKYATSFAISKEKTCYMAASAKSHTTPPANDVPTFIFQTVDIDFLVLLDGAPLKSAEVTFRVINTSFVNSCSTNDEGKCTIKKILEGATFGYTVKYGGRTVEGSGTAVINDSIVVSFSNKEQRNQSVNMSSAQQPLNSSDLVPFVFYVVGTDDNAPIWKRNDVAYLIYLPEYNLTVAPNQSFLVDRSARKFKLLAFGREMYEGEFTPSQGSYTINISEIPCTIPCNICWCDGNNVCTFSSFYSSYGCCPVGKSWNRKECVEHKGFKIFFVTINLDIKLGPSHKLLQAVIHMQKQQMLNSV